MHICFDLAVTKKAYALVWQQHRSLWRNCEHGWISCICAFMGTLGKYVRCRGFEEILIDSGIYVRGSTEKVKTGKHYNRAILVHRIVAEGVECLLLMKFQETRDGRISESNLSDAGTYTKQGELVWGTLEWQLHTHAESVHRIPRSCSEGRPWEDCQDVDAVPGLCIDVPQIPKRNEGE